VADRPHTVEAFVALRRNCHVLEYTHFSAADRTNTLNLWLGAPAVLISVVLGSTFFVLLTKEIPAEAKWAGAIGALVVAVLGSLQTFFNFQKTSESHRTVANRYLNIARDSELLIASYYDGLIPLSAMSERLAELNASYAEVNKAAERVRTSASDYTYGLRRHGELEADEAKRKTAPTP